MSVYDRPWERDDARRREQGPAPRGIESDIERWARTRTHRSPRAPRPLPQPEPPAAMPALLVGLGLVAAALLLVVLVLFLSGAVTMTYIPAH